MTIKKLNYDQSLLLKEVFCLALKIKVEDLSNQSADCDTIVDLSSDIARISVLYHSISSTRLKNKK